MIIGPGKKKLERPCETSFISSVWSTFLSIIILHSNQLCLEHMEEDEETPKAIPPWVELEYAVRNHSQLLK